MKNAQASKSLLRQRPLQGASSRATKAVGNTGSIVSSAPRHRGRARPLTGRNHAGCPDPSVRSVDDRRLPTECKITSGRGGARNIVGEHLIRRDFLRLVLRYSDVPLAVLQSRRRDNRVYEVKLCFAFRVLMSIGFPSDLSPFAAGISRQRESS